MLKVGRRAWGMDVNDCRRSWDWNIRNDGKHPGGHRTEEVLDWYLCVQQGKRRHRGDRRKGERRNADKRDDPETSTAHQKGNFTVASPA